MTFRHWIHHLFQPHCEQCKNDSEEREVCKSCEILKQQLEIANFEKSQLLNMITSKPAPEERAEINYDKVKPKMITWRVRQQMLEAEDRERARILREQRKSDDKVIDEEVDNE